MLKLAKTFVHTVMPGVIKPLHILWNEIIGFFFVVLAIGTAPAGWRYYKAIDSDPRNAFRLGLTVVFGLTMLWFGLTSFLKARKIKRQGLSVVRS